MTTKFMLDDGKRVAVVRPSEPAVAIRIARECLRDNDTKRLDDLLTEAASSGCSYTFVGYLSDDGKTLLDDSAKPIGRPELGDSLIDEACLKEES